MNDWIQLDPERNDSEKKLYFNYLCDDHFLSFIFFKFELYLEFVTDEYFDV